jgi:hypothetical protein
MIEGSCLCGGVRFKISRAAGPFELCHCSRCRKVSGSAFVASLGVRTRDYRLLQGADLIATFELPLVEHPPAYGVSFCSRCGSSVPNPDPDSDHFEIPAGLLDNEPGARPDRHIFTHIKSSWFEIADDLPQLDKKALIELRFGPK